MELFFLAVLFVLMIYALGSGYPVAFALPGSAIVTILLAGFFGLVIEGDSGAFACVSRGVEARTSSEMCPSSAQMSGRFSLTAWRAIRSASRIALIDGVALPEASVVVPIGVEAHRCCFTEAYDSIHSPHSLKRARRTRS